MESYDIITPLICELAFQLDIFISYQVGSKRSCKKRETDFVYSLIGLGLEVVTSILFNLVVILQTISIRIRLISASINSWLTQNSRLQIVAACKKWRLYIADQLSSWKHGSKDHSFKKIGWEMVFLIASTVQEITVADANDYNILCHRVCLHWMTLERIRCVLTLSKGYISKRLLWIFAQQCEWNICRPLCSKTFIVGWLLQIFITLVCQLERTFGMFSSSSLYRAGWSMLTQHMLLLLRSGLSSIVRCCSIIVILLLTRCRKDDVTCHNRMWMTVLFTNTHVFDFLVISLATSNRATRILTRHLMLEASTMKSREKSFVANFKCFTKFRLPSPENCVRTPIHRYFDLLIGFFCIWITPPICLQPCTIENSSLWWPS